MSRFARACRSGGPRRGQPVQHGQIIDQLREGGVGQRDPSRVQREEITRRAEVFERQRARRFVRPEPPGHPVRHRLAGGGELVEAGFDERTVERGGDVRILLQPGPRLLEDETARRGEHPHGAVHVALARFFRAPATSRPRAVVALGRGIFRARGGRTRRGNKRRDGASGSRLGGSWSAREHDRRVPVRPTAGKTSGPFRPSPRTRKRRMRWSAAADP